MPRIRSLKPEMVEDEALGRCCIGAQLTFDRLITQADDHGRFRAAGVLLKGKLFPYLEDLSAEEIDQWVAELERADLLQTYTVRGQSFGVLRSWGKHQRIDNAAKPLHPGPDDADRGEPPRDSAGLREIPPFAAGEERRGEEKEGSGTHARARGGPMDSPYVAAFLAAGRAAGVSDVVLAPSIGAVDARTRELAETEPEALLIAACADLGRKGGDPRRLDIEVARIQRGQLRSTSAIGEATAALLRAEGAA